MIMLGKNNKGITLVALVITIVILLILAGISISTLTNTGIFEKAKDAKKASENAKLEQNKVLDEYEKELDKYMPQELTDDKINKVLNMTENTFLKDANGNIFTLPAGFKVVVNDDTGNAKTVDKGIVIEDATVDSNGNPTATNGSQFVWISVGTITRENGEKVKIEFNRYVFYSNGNITPQNENVIETYFRETASKGNKIAKSIENFKKSVEINGGYYIGRYEARKNSIEKITEVGTDIVWNNITQANAATMAQTMYNNSNFTSDLMNSYAWDTAALFLQSCGTNSNYSRQPSLNDLLAQTGTNNLIDINKIDKQCNVFDMASNIREWTTETSSLNNMPCTNRGGYYGSDNYTTNRYHNDELLMNDIIGFRPILYINV